jgi:tyrosinase
MKRYGRFYAPDMTAPAAIYKGERIDDPIVSLLRPGGTPRTVLDLSAIYAYNVLTLNPVPRPTEEAQRP